jgi:hypothetical protein
MTMFDTEDQMRCAFAAFALQGLITGMDIELLDDEHTRIMLSELAFEMADSMMGVRNASVRH